MKDETIADLKQEKSYTEMKVSRLERQIENFYNMYLCLIFLSVLLLFR